MLLYKKNSEDSIKYIVKYLDILLLLILNFTRSDIMGINIATL